MALPANIPSIKFGDKNANCGNIIGSYNVYKSDEDAQISRWLSPLEPSRHQGVCTDRFGGVGDWLSETREWKEWRCSHGGAEKAVLFCSGSPGVGKTYLSSIVIDTLCDQADGEGIAVAGLYYDFLAQQEQTITNMMGSILKQLVGRDIPKYVREEFQQAKRGISGGGPRLADLIVMLRTTIASLRQVFICIDALDECLPKRLPEVLESLRDIAWESPTTRIFLTGRPHVKEDIQRYFLTAAVVLISPSTDDIKGCLEMKFGRDVYPEAMNDGLRAAIVRTILEKSSDIFLLVSLNIDAILGEVTIRQRREKLEEVERGNGLRDAYTTTLTRLKAQEKHISILGLKVLTWVMHSERPLRKEELCHALGVEIGSADLDPENVPASRILLASCLGLVTVEASSSTVRLVHFTLREHLSHDPTLLHHPHSTIAEVCLTYLNFRCIRDLSPSLCSAPSTMPLLEYASYYWGEHTRKGMTENVKVLALMLLDKFDEHISARLLLLRYNQDRISGPYFHGLGGPTGFTGLHGVAFLGVAEIVTAVLGMKEWDVNAADCMGSTALTWAVRRGQDEVVKVLLEREDIDLNIAGTQDGRTPLMLATENGHEGLVRILLERQDINPNTADTKYGQKPLSWAAKSGREGVAKMLLEPEDVRAATPGNKNHAPLPLARSKEHDAIVGILPERENPNPDTRGRSQASLPSSIRTVGEFMGNSYLNTEAANLSDQPAAEKPAAEKQVVEKLVATEPVENLTLNGQRIGERLKDVITNYRTCLRNMYGESEAELDISLEAPIKKGEEMARKLITMGCNIEVAKDLTLLTLYDVAILIDDSDSMVNEEEGARKKTLIQFIDHITEIYSMANQSGILAMRFMNGSGGKKNWTGKSQNYLERHNYEGLTRIGTELKKKILNKFVIGNPEQRKPLLVLIITDGTAEGEKEGHLKNVIRDCVYEREGAGKGLDAVTFQFSRIGNDTGAAMLLEDLSQDVELKDFVNVFPVEFDLKSLSEDKWFVLPKILLGAILPDWHHIDDNIYTGHNYFANEMDENSGHDWYDSGDEWDD